MISDILDHEEGARLEADVVVVGSGVAGSEAALFLSRRGASVLLLESGREEFDPSIQALYDLDFVGKRHRPMDPEVPFQRYLPDHLRGVSRVRQFGGTTNVWTGKWKPFEETDFHDREWVSGSGWPITVDTLRGHYTQLAEEYGFGDFEDTTSEQRGSAIGRALDAAGLRLSPFYWQEKPLRTRLRFGDEMRGSSTLKVVLGASATEIRTQGASGPATEIICKSLEGRSVTACGRHFVLAAGGIETARLLLASRGANPRGLGNDRDLVGRFYMDHLKHRTGLLQPGPLLRRFAPVFQHDPKPRFCSYVSLDFATQRSEGLLEHALYLKPRRESRGRRVARLARMKPACIDETGRVADYVLTFVTEQTPYRESRVRLGEETDALGVPKTVIDWRVAETDKRAIRRIAALLADRAAAVGLGHIDYGDASPAVENMSDAAHQMGTTRMAERPEEGVTDSRCRVFGVENLYIASASVFPSGPAYSLTYTILALARRIGVEIDAIRKRSTTRVAAM